MKQLAFKTRLHLNNKQETELKIYLDTARVAYNFGVGQFQEKFQYWENSNFNKDFIPRTTIVNNIDKLFNKIKENKYPFLYRNGKLIAPACVAQQAIKKNLKIAIDKFHKNNYTGSIKDKHNNPKFFPNFKKNIP